MTEFSFWAELTFSEPASTIKNLLLNGKVLCMLKVLCRTIKANKELLFFCACKCTNECG